MNKEQQPENNSGLQQTVKEIICLTASQAGLELDLWEHNQILTEAAKDIIDAVLDSIDYDNLLEQQEVKPIVRKQIGYQAPDNSLISENDYQFLSDSQKAQCKPFYSSETDLVEQEVKPVSGNDELIKHISHLVTEASTEHWHPDFLIEEIKKAIYEQVEDANTRWQSLNKNV